MRIDFFFDPSCPWCWATSRWLTEVAPQRDVDIHWRSFSLYEKNKELESEYAQKHRSSSQAAHRLLRVAEALRADTGNNAVAAFYTETGARVHQDVQELEDVDAGDVLRAIGAAESHASATTDDTWDAVIRASMDEALALAGGEIGVPCIAYDQKAAYFGPVITPAPQGEGALELFDALATMARMDGFFELKRTRDRRPEFHERPETPNLAATSQAR